MSAARSSGADDASILALGASSAVGTLNSHKTAATGELVEAWREQHYTGRLAKQKEVQELGLLGDRDLVPVTTARSGGGTGWEPRPVEVNFTGVGSHDGGLQE